MFSIANLLERAKANGKIESDYRLAKVLRINQTRLSNYRTGRSLPNAEMVEALCALSGDDSGLIVAQVEASRAPEGPVRAMWESVAERLSNDRRKVGRGITTAILSVCFAITLIAGYASPAQAGEASSTQEAKVNLLYIVSNAILSAEEFLLVRLRRFTGLLRFTCWFIAF